MISSNIPKWEYVTYLFGNYSSKYELVLDRYGKEGWELVSVDNSIAYFKRPIKEQVVSNIYVNGIPLKQVYDD